MARTPSTMVPLGQPAPDFALTDAVSGETVRKSDFDGKPLLVMFICNHCPFVIHVMPELDRLTSEYGDKVEIIAVNANDLEHYPQDGPDNMKALAQERGWKFPFLFDATQEVARAYDAACTPDFFVYDANHTLYYRGQLDDTRPGGPDPDGADLRAALDALIAGKDAPEKQFPSMGCNIKWKA